MSPNRTGLIADSHGIGWLPSFGTGAGSDAVIYFNAILRHHKGPNSGNQPDEVLCHEMVLM